ncbi:MAG: PGN_0703 family putative restriction endonuclease, partial [Methylocella sp.]
KMRRDPCPLDIAQPEIVRHDSGPPGQLESRLGNQFNRVQNLVYDNLIAAEDSPFKRIEPRALYFGPFYQMMRRTLLGWQISKHEDHDCTSYSHIHVVPEQNAEFHRKVTSPLLKGASVSEAWLAVLRRPELYIGTTPANFMRPVVEERDTKALTGYLKSRYWSAI